MRAADELGRKFAETHPADAARVLERAEPEEAAAFLDGIPIAAAADLVKRMNLQFAAGALSALEVGQAARILEGLPLHNAARVLRHAKPDAAEALLESMAENVARPLRRLLRYREGTAGALADPKALTVSSDMNVGDAQKQLRRLAADASNNVYVTDRDHRIVGVVTIPELLLARPKQRIEAIMQRQLVRLAANADLAGVAGDRAWLEYDTLPVIDKDDTVVGVIRHQTIRRLADTRDKGPELAFLIDTALTVADLYWRSLSGLGAALAVAAAAQTSDGPQASGR